MLCGVENVRETVVLFDPNSQSINIITIPEDSMTQYSSRPGIVTVADNGTGTSPIYLGFCVSLPDGNLTTMEGQPIWQIAYYTYDIAGNFLTQTWGEGGANGLIWNNRTQYDYS